MTPLPPKSEASEFVAGIVGVLAALGIATGLFFLLMWIAHWIANHL